jgi:hypothetical protein
MDKLAGVDLFKSWIRYGLKIGWLLWRAGYTRDSALFMAAEGQIRKDEALCLYEFAQKAPRGGVIVEIGSYRGAATIALAKGSLRGPRIPVYAIDPHDYIDPGDCADRSGWVYDSQDNAAFSRNMLFAGVGEWVRPINLLSSEAVAGWTRPISLLWIDGDHEFQAVIDDFKSWSQWVLPGGYVALHDSIDPAAGPFRVVREALAGGQFDLVKQAEKISVMCRRGHETESPGLGPPSQSKIQP